MSILKSITGRDVENITQTTTTIHQQMVDEAPTNIMTCRLDDFVIDYANRQSIETLKTIEQILPCKAEDLVGQSIDIFHKNPEHQRRMLSNPANLPHKAQIEIGGEILDLLVTPIINNGQYVKPMLTWQLITDRVRIERETAKLMRMLDDMPINVMLADPKTCEITYVNRTSKETLRPLQDLLAVPVDDLLGTTIDVFHKNPAHQRSILADEKNLPFRSKIKLGEHTLDLRVSAVTSDDGDYLGAMLTWSVVTAQVRLADEFETNVKGVVDIVSSSSTELKATSESMASIAEDGGMKAATVSSACEQLNSSISEISEQVSRATQIGQDANVKAKTSNDQVQGLAEAASQIDEVINLIKDIADQTNLLALNATIEAARAGDAGKGFAVVASEVKSLANQTAKATDDIAGKISEMQTATQQTVTAIQDISAVIEEISEIQTAVSAAVEQQTSATREVAENITGVSTASEETRSSAGEVLQAADGLSQHSEELASEVDKFLVEVRSL